MAAARNEFQRFASPNELRMVAREELGFYHAVVVGAVYEVAVDVDLSSPETYFHPLSQCIRRHPYLAVTIGDAHTDKAFYERVSTISLKNHVSVAVIPHDGHDLGRIQRVLASDLDRPFQPGSPPWRINVLPLQKGQCFIAYAYSHAIGDGTSGMAFHRTFLEALRETSAIHSTQAGDGIVRTEERFLPQPFDTPERLPISWSFLLAPLLSLFLPTSVMSLLGLVSSQNPADDGTWTGSHIFFPSPDRLATNIVLREIDAAALGGVLRAARRHDAKLTGVLHQIVVRALSKAVTDRNITNFVSQTPFNMRKAIGASDDEMGNFGSASYLRHPRVEFSSTISEASWIAAGQATRQLAADAATLEDQAVGLLRYVPSVRKWILGKLGKRRDCSYEVSNIGVFVDSSADHAGEQATRITKVTFAFPGHVISQPLAFGFASVKGGSLVYSATWKPGTLGLESDEEEVRFVESLCTSMQQDLESLS